MRSSCDYEDESGEFSPLFPKTHKPLPFAPSPLRDAETQLALQACADMGCESITAGQARKWGEIQRNRARNAHYAARAKARKAAKGKA
jgi:hypothetical protein